MAQRQFTPTPHEYRGAVQLNTLLIAVCLVAIAVMVIGLAFADNWNQLVVWMIAAAAAVLAICALAFVAGLYRGGKRG
jgi:O-antigen/teichoic acid export membrane protein